MFFCSGTECIFPALEILPLKNSKEGEQKDQPRSAAAWVVSGRVLNFRQKIDSREFSFVTFLLRKKKSKRCMNEVFLEILLPSLAATSYSKRT